MISSHHCVITWFLPGLNEKKTFLSVVFPIPTFTTCISLHHDQTQCIGQMMKILYRAYSDCSYGIKWVERLIDTNLSAAFQG